MVNQKPGAATEAAVRSIRTSLTPNSTPTEESVRLLHAVLGLTNTAHREHTECKESSIQKPPRRPATASAPRVTKPGKDKTGTFKIHEDETTNVLPLPPLRRKAFTTEVFNTSLKILSLATKKKIARRSATRDPSTIGGQETYSGKLQQCSPNRQPAAKPKSHAHRLASRGEDGSDLFKTAELTSLALEFLRQDGNEEEAENTVEKGAIVFLDKLITLDLTAQAMIEAGRIHEQYWKRRKQQVRTVSSQVLVDLITNFVPPDSKEHFDFVTSFQAQVLRLMVLEGPRCVTAQLLKSMSVKNACSPGFVILEGIKKCTITNEKAGSSLLVVYQALSRIYSTYTKEDIAKRDGLLQFELFQRALEHKIYVSKFSQKAGLSQSDLGAQFSFAAKQFTSGEHRENSSRREVALRALQEFENMMHELQLNFHVPEDIIRMLGEPKRTESVEAAPDPKGEALSRSAKARNSDGKEMIIRLASGLQSTEDRTEECLELCELVLLDLNTATTADADYARGMLLELTRLRRAATGVVIDVQTASSDGKVNALQLRLQTLCARLLFMNLRCQLLCADGLPGDLEPAERVRLFTSFVKTIESIFQIDKCSITHSASLSGECNQALMDTCVLSELCLSQMQSCLKDDCVAAFLRSVRVRVSACYWARYLHGVSSRSDASVLQNLLELSIEAILPEPPRVKQTSHICLKYEKLASLHEDRQDYHRSLDCLRKALELYCDSGTLNDAVDKYLISPSRLAWVAADTSVNALGKLLEKFGSLACRSVANDRDIGWLWNNHTLPSLHRGVVMWKQIQGCRQSDMSSMQHSAIAFAVLTVLKLLGDDEFMACRLQIASKYLYNRSKQENPVVLSDLDELLANDVERRSLPSESHLQGYQSILRLTTRIQWLLHEGQTEFEALAIVVSDLVPLLQRCRTQDEFEAVVDDFEILIVQLRALADIMSFHEDKLLTKGVLSCLQHLLASKSPAYDETLMRCSISLSLVHLHEADILSAGNTLGKSRRLLEELNAKPFLAIDCHLAQAEYYYELSSSIASTDCIAEAKQLWETISSDRTLSSSLPRLSMEKALAKASLLLSQISLTSGNHKQAYVLGRKAVKLSMSMWSSIARQLEHADDSSTVNVSFSGLTDAMLKLDLDGNNTSKTRNTQGASYWPFVHLYTASLQNMVNLSTLTGLFQDAVYFAQQALKVATACRSANAIDVAQAQLAVARARGGLSVDMDIQSSTDQRLMARSCFDQAQLLLDMAEVTVLTGDIPKAIVHLSRIPQALSTIVVPTRTPTTLVSSTKKIPRSAKVPPPKPHTKKKTQVGSTTLSCGPPSKQKQPESDKPCVRLRNIQNRLERLQIELRLKCPGSTEVRPIPAPTGQEPNDPECLTSLALLKLQETIEAFSKDATTSVLPETALALPMRYNSTRRSGRISFVQGSAPDDDLVDVVQVEANYPSRRSADSNSAQDLMQTSIRMMLRGNQQHGKLAAVYTMHTVSAMLTKASLLGVSLKVPLSFVPSRLILHSLGPKDEAYRRERHAITAENITAAVKESKVWPATNELSTLEKICPELEPGSLPDTWAVVSISIDHEKEDLLIARLEPKRSPFIVRLPLSRSKDEVADSVNLTYQVAKQELYDIISQANESAHDARGQADKQTRKAWYAEREQLDNRLHDLLLGIENTWFGGFRGLLSSAQIDDNLHSTFGTSLAQSLDKHLPSRQRMSKHDTSKVALHAHVLELFVSAGHPDQDEFDDTIMDLLYFIVDILQFNGEPNAYDEIDFDALLVDVLDALRAYHEAYNSQRHQQADMHTILILDKELQAFPWESLPVMRGQSVSRLPCLQALKDRLALIQNQALDPHAYTIPANKGSYILNPSSDLTSTQSTFQPIFSSQLPSFTSSINISPTEEQFSSCLTDHSLFLYFGHGSGAQYIRGRTIRKMDKCAVALLMGCSSAKLTECGLFESYGVPWNYMHAGSPAVVGTLWDVTDRDIDRFALRTLEEWGLVEDDEVLDGNKKIARGGAKAVGKGKRKEKDGDGGKERVKMEDRRGKVSLDTAVAKARESCMLKYLKGAAPVVYGVPVVLK